LFPRSIYVYLFIDFTMWLFAQQGGEFFRMLKSQQDRRIPEVVMLHSNIYI